MCLRKYLPQSFWGLYKHYLKLESLIMLVCAFTLTSDFSACKCVWPGTAYELGNSSGANRRHVFSVV